MDNNNFTQNNNQNDAGLQNTAQQDVYPQGMNPQDMYQNGMYQNGMYQQNMVQQNVYQQTMNGQGMVQPGMAQQNTYQQGLYQQNMYQQNTYQQGMYQPDMAQQNMYGQGNQTGLTRKEFINLPQMGNVKKNINACVILLYFVAGFNFVMGITGSSASIVLFDVALIFLLGFLLQMTYSNLVGFICLGYGILNMIIFIIYYGYPGGILIVLIGVYAASSTYKFNKAWTEYINTGKLPTTMK